MLLYQSDRAGMIRFHVIYNQIINGTFANHLLYFTQVDFKITDIYRIHQCHHFIINQIRVI